MAANRLLEPMPRNEEQIIRDAIRSGMFMNSAPSIRAALLCHIQTMETNAQLRAVRERRRAMDEAKRTQMDYDRRLSETVQRRIPPLQTFGHQMNNRRRVAREIKLS